MRQNIWHLFHQIDLVFRPNEEAVFDRKYPISQNKLGQGDGSRSTLKTVLGWDLDTISHLIRLPPRRQEKVAAALSSAVAAIPRKAHSTSMHKWRNLLGLLRSITPAISGSRGMFTRVQYDLKIPTRRHVQLSADVHDEMEIFGTN